MMGPIPVAAVFDVGKTNKKFLLFDEDYRAVHQEMTQIPEDEDEEGFPCEDVLALAEWMRTTFERAMQDGRFRILALNFAAYGASFVFLDKDKQLLLPMYNYLKPFAPELLERFYAENGGKEEFARAAASPVLGSLNSGMQLYRLRHEQPEKFAQVAYAVHLPQYLSFAFTGKLQTDMTSVGCHTNLWDFDKGQYHPWVALTGIEEKFPPLVPSNAVVGTIHGNVAVGAGLHDSSASVLPYRKVMDHPFLLLSTGSWSICMAPFQQAPLTAEELAKDCLFYFGCDGVPVKASRLAAGLLHDQGIEALCKRFGNTPQDYLTMQPTDDECMLVELKMMADPLLRERFNAADWITPSEGYVAFMLWLVDRQMEKVALVSGGGAQHMYVDGGFSKHGFFMRMLKKVLPELHVHPAELGQCTAMGAAMVLHERWNSKGFPKDLIDLDH
jgi:sugar (pentulose or hexulose) kinase